MMVEHEGDAARFLAAMRITRDLLAGRAAGLPVASEDLAQLLDLLTAEAARVVPSTPILRAYCND
jgi:hypothetical protein